MEDYWALFAATGAPVFYLLYRHGLGHGDTCAAWGSAAGQAEV